MWLEHLPTEVLANILNGDSSWASIELWKCGNRLLSSKLVLSGITLVHLDVPGVKECRRLPECLKQFRLSRVRFTASHIPHGSSTLHEDLRKLHYGLRALEVKCRGALDLLFPVRQKIVFSETERLICETKVHFKVVRSSIDPTHSNLPPLSQVYNRLEHLKIDEICPSSPALEDRIFGLLPRSLTSLHIQGCRAPVNSSLFDSLPSELTHLSLPPNTIHPLHLRQLPRFLTSISNCLTEEALALLATGGENGPLLPYLASFPCDGRFLAGSPIFQVLASGGRRLPDNMLRLELDGVPKTQIFSLLPKNIQSLSLTNAHSKFDLCSGFLEQIYSSLLTVLAVDTVDWSEMSASLWPQNLTALTVRSSPTFGSHCFYKLPRSLVLLKVNANLLVPPSEPNSEECNNRASLMLQGRILLNSLEKVEWQKYRLKLENRSERLAEGEWSAVRRQFDSIEGGALLGLPLRMRSLELGGMRHTSGLNLSLPPWLTEARLESVAEIKCEEFFSSLPPTLTRLVLNPPYHDYLDEPSCWEVLSGEDPALSALYKSSLLSLSLSFWASPSAPSIIKYLPRDLRELEFNAMEATFKAETWRDLPPSLERLQLRCFAIDRDGCPMSSLPKTLTCFDLNDASINGSDLAHLPPNIESLSAAILDTSLDHILAAPKSLRRIKQLAEYPITDVIATEGDRGALHLMPIHWNRLCNEFIPFYKIWKQSKSDLLCLLSD